MLPRATRRLFYDTMRYNPKNGDIGEIARFIGDTSRRNHAYIKKPNKSNYTLYVYGLISRIVGLFNSCPSSHFKTFNLDPKVVPEWGVDDVILATGINIQNFGLDRPAVKFFFEIRSLVMTNPGGIPITQISLTDPAFVSRIEDEIFEDGDIVRSGGEKPAPVSAIGAADDFAEHITPRELIAYESAKKHKNQDILREIYETYISRKAKKSSGFTEESSRTQS